MSESIPKTLAEKLTAARKNAQTVKKKGEGRDGNGNAFRFARAEDVGKEARRLQRKYDIVVIPSALPGLSKMTLGKTGVLAEVGMQFKVMDGETGEYFTEEWVGTGFDKYGSGAASLATTTATKAFISGLLGIAFEPDPEERAGATAVATEDKAEKSEPVHALLIGTLLKQLRDLGRGEDLDSLNLLLGSCGIEALQDSEQPLAERELHLFECQVAALYAELMRMQQDHDATEVGAGG